VPLEGREVEEIRRVADSGLAVRPWPYLKPGERVRVERGPLRGLEGTVLREEHAWRLVVGLDLLRRSIAVDLEPDMIAPARLAASGRGAA
jgi:transcription antitermination factor NusG